MIIRLILALTLSALFGANAWACSCASWSGHVSEFAENYISVWAVPTSATVTPGDIGKPGKGVTYRLDILEGYDRITKTDINVISGVADGGTCGVQLTLGTAQFISAYNYGNELYEVSSCTPKPPYNAVKRYLETAEDSFIPAWSDCHSWPEDEYYTPSFNKETEACSVWKGADHINGYHGAKDRRKYNEVWWNKIESAEPKKKRRWWSFNKY